MAFVDFTKAKQSFSLEEVCSWYGVILKKDGTSSLRSSCPICKGEGDRAFVVTPAKQMWYCFSTCQRGGDIIALVSGIEDIPVKDAAAKILARFESPRPTQPNELKPLDYLQPDHPAMQAIMPADLAKRIGAGYAPKGILSGRCLLPIRDETGKLLFYVGFSEKLDPKWKLPKNL